MNLHPHPTTYTSEHFTLYVKRQPSNPTLAICISAEATTLAEMDHVPLRREDINTVQGFLCPPNNLLFIAIALSATRFMNTRAKNKSKHPGIPDMTPAQLASAGLSSTPAACSRKPTKDQQIAALKDELRTIRELISNVSRSTI